MVETDLFKVQLVKIRNMCFCYQYGSKNDARVVKSVTNKQGPALRMCGDAPLLPPLFWGVPLPYTNGTDLSKPI